MPSIVQASAQHVSTAWRVDLVVQGHKSAAVHGVYKVMASQFEAFIN